MANFTKRNRQAVPVELFGAAIEAIARLPERDRKNAASRVVTLLYMMDAHNVPSALEARSALLMGIELRMKGLARLQDHPSYRAWSVKSGTPRRHSVHADLIAAAASAPLLSRRVARFEPQSFFQLVLAISEARGHG